MEALLAAFTYDPIQRFGPVSPHGLGTALGFFAGAYLMARRAEPRGIPRTEIYNAVTWGAVGAIIGARGFYVLGHLDQFPTVTEMLKVWEGGLTMFGGFIGGLTLGLAYLRRRRFDIVQSLDAAAPGFVVGVIIGRIGDILIADHLGQRTNFFLGYKIPPNADIAPGYGPANGYVPGVVVHHTAVYDLLGALVLLGVIYAIARRKPRPGILFATFALWYGVQRFLIDFTRNRELIESVYFGFSGSQWAGLFFAAAGAAALYRISRRPLPSTPVPVPVVPEPPLAAAPSEAPPLGGLAGPASPPAPFPPSSPPTAEPSGPPPPPPPPVAPPPPPVAPPPPPVAPPPPETS